VLKKLYTRMAGAKHVVRARKKYPQLSRRVYLVHLEPYGTLDRPRTDDECKAAVRGVLEGLRELHAAGMLRSNSDHVERVRMPVYISARYIALQRLGPKTLNIRNSDCI
jgi:uncharacterized NAD(P)/FAD-binding protein YdhS